MAVCHVLASKIRESSPPGQNFMKQMTTPTRFLLIILGLGDNNFRNPWGRFLYFIYFWLVIGFLLVCLVWHILTILMQFGVKLYEGWTIIPPEVENDVDKYAEIGRTSIFVYRHVITLWFLVCTVPLRRLSRLCEMWDRSLGFVAEILDKAEHGRWLTKKKKYLLTANTILIVYFTIILAIDIKYYLLGNDSSLVLLDVIMVHVIPNVVITLVLAQACSVYLCTSAAWDCYNQSLGELAVRESDRSIEQLTTELAARYDVLSDFTEAVSDYYRYYHTVHIANVAVMVATVYESIYATIPVFVKVLCWVFELMHLSAFAVAATVYAFSSATPRCLYKFYKDRMTGGVQLVKRDNTPFHYFHHYVAHEWAPISLDAAGVLGLTYTAMGVLVFTAVNWIGVIIQFRQGSSGNSTAATCGDVMDFLKVANLSVRPH